MRIKGKLVDIHKREIYSAAIDIEDGRIERIARTDDFESSYILPGFIDAHVHIESSMLSPGAFARASVPHGTIGVVSDPHEIANVIGPEGIEYMILEGKKTPLRFYFGAPSCVPATEIESNGAVIGVEEVEKLIGREEILYLAEMMNYPGVINSSPGVIEKIRIARKYGKPVDGHAPGVTGKDLKRYIDAGISTDHECSSYEEAVEKINLGMKIIIREGSAGRNLNALKSLYSSFPDKVMLGSDDIHPEMLRKRHLDKLVTGLLDEGFNLFDVLKSTSYNQIKHYNLDAGILQPGDKADFIITDDPRKMNILETWINGEKVFDRGRVLFDYSPPAPINNFNCSLVNSEQIAVKKSGKEMRVILAFDGELYTRELIYEPQEGTEIKPDISEDILKIVVKDRYRDLPPATGFIKGFGLKKGAFASSVAHDSHNIIAIGTCDEDILSAINEVIRKKGGLAVAVDGSVKSLELNIAGIMSDKSCETVADDYEELSGIIKKYGCKMAAPFMTLSFMALLVIPELKMSDRGLFDGKSFSHVPLFLG